MAECILVVEEEVARKAITSVLGSTHYDCREARDRLGAIAALDSGEDVALMLSNIMMPELDGIGLLECVKDNYPDMPVVVVTTVHDVSVALAAIRNGAYDYLLKPFTAEQLLATVRRALEYRRLKVENRAQQEKSDSMVDALTERLKNAITNLERAYDLTLEAFGDALALRDSETGEHSKRVTAYVIAMARRIGLSKNEVSMIGRAAFLHDMGKLAIPDCILRKPQTLTSDEAATMHQYVYRGYEMIRKVPFLVDAAEIVYCHQERYDGSGYPRGLRGEEIPLGARIVAVANTLDAITSDRPYRRAQSLGAAREEIQRWSGRQFDPVIASTFAAMPANVWEDVRRDIDAQK